MKLDFYVIIDFWCPILMYSLRLTFLFVVLYYHFPVPMNFLMVQTEPHSFASFSTRDSARGAAGELKLCGTLDPHRVRGGARMESQAPAALRRVKEA